MPDLPISQLPELTAITSSAEFVIEQAGTTYKVRSGYTSTGKIYGVFTSTVTQTSTGLANTVILMSAATTVIGTQGVTIVDGSKFTVLSGGTFNLQFSAQMDKSGGSAASVTVWFRINGLDIPNSSTYFNLSNNNSFEIIAWNYVDTLLPGQYFQICWSTTNQDVYIPYTIIGTAPVRPAAPSVIVTLVQV